MIVRPGNTQTSITFLFDFARLDRASAPLSCFHRHPQVANPLSRMLSSSPCGPSVRVCDCLLNSVGFHSPVGRIPHYFALSQNKHLRSFMHYTCFLLDLLRKTPRALDLDKGDITLEPRHLGICRCTDRARPTMLKNHHCRLLRSAGQLLKRINVRNSHNPFSLSPFVLKLD